MALASSRISALNRAVAWMLPAVPRAVVHAVARRYIAGVTTDDAVACVRRLNAEGFSATLDILGENSDDLAQARRFAEEYVLLLRRIAAEQIDSNISLKITKLGVRLDIEETYRNVRWIVSEAEKLGNFVRMDMEDSPVTSATLELFGRLRAEFDNVGAVLQAYLRRTGDDVGGLLAQRDARLNVRLCKGIYTEPEEIAFQERGEISDNFVTQAGALLAGGAYLAFATHDLDLVGRCERLIEEARTGYADHEFQSLLGVPVQTTLARLRDAGHKVRVYVPFGDHWYDYSVRRLKENPRLATYVLKGMIAGQS